MPKISAQFDRGHPQQGRRMQVGWVKIGDFWQITGYLSKTVKDRHIRTHTHNRLMALSPGLPGWASTRKVKPIWILLKQETVSGVGISWAICKSAPRSRQITTPAPHHCFFYRPDALPAAQPTASKHWRHEGMQKHVIICVNFTVWYRDSVNNTVEENSSDIVFSIILMRWLPSARACRQ